MSNVYSFIDVYAAIVGPGIACSLGAGAAVSEEGITITPAGEIGAMQIGADGTGQHSLYADKSGKVVVRLLKTSPVNKLLSAALAFQRSNGASYGQNTITINDSNRGDVITCQQCGFSKVPDFTYAKEAGMVEWEFNSILIEPTLGS